MTFKKKLRKLHRDPQAFFADSSNPVIQTVCGLVPKTLLRAGIAKNSTNVPSLKSQPSDQSIKAKVVKKNTVATRKSMFEEVRAMDAVFGDANIQVDLWRTYRALDLQYISGLNTGPTIAVYPLGVPAMDRMRNVLYQSDGCTTFFLPLWEHIDSLNDLDDLEYRANREPLMANSIARQLLAVAVARKATAVILPYDGTALTRSIVIQSRALGLITICHLPSYSPALELYGTGRVASFPISDWIVVDEGFAEKLSFPSSVMQRCSLIPHASEARPLKLNEVQEHRLRLLIGAGVTEDIRVAILAPLQLTMSNEIITAITHSQVEGLLSRTKPIDHLVIVAKRRKRGFMNDEVVKLLREKYRKTVLLYDDVDLEAVLSIAKEAVMPDGLLPSEYYRNEKITSYAVEDQEQKNALAGIDYDAEAEAEAEAEETSSQKIQVLSAICFQHPGFNNLITRSRSNVLADTPFGICEDILGRILDSAGPGLDIIAVPDPITNLPITEGRQKHLLELLHSNRRVYGASSLHEASAAEVFVQWGAEPSESKERPEVFRSHLARPRLFLEDGFIRSKGLWTDPNEPTLSVVMDTRAIYYNSLQPSLLETILNSDFQLSDALLARARHLIDAIVVNRISKYNHAPVLDLDFRVKDKKSILIVDQKAGDMSIKYGIASDDNFFAMLQAAVELGDDVEIIIKQHPCAISGGAHEAHFTAESLGGLIKQNNVHLIGFDINPYSLITAVDEVWVVSSGMGFEALMAGKSVRCFGAPFYSNWGITRDEVRIDRRSRQRSLEEIFYVFYVMLSRYVDPLTGKLCEIERLIEYFSSSNTIVKD